MFQIFYFNFQMELVIRIHFIRRCLFNTVWTTNFKSIDNCIFSSYILEMKITNKKFLLIMSQYQKIHAPKKMRIKCRIENNCENQFILKHFEKDFFPIDFIQLIFLKLNLKNFFINTEQKSVVSKGNIVSFLFKFEWSLHEQIFTYHVYCGNGTLCSLLKNVLLKFRKNNLIFLELLKSWFLGQ